MSFWANKLGAQPSTPAIEPVQTQTAPPGAPWWQQPAYAVAPPATPHYQQVQQQPVTTPTQARSARHSATCPDCGSENYFSRRQDGNGLLQCYECGYNDRFTHSTHGAGLPGGQSSGPATPSKQVASGGAGGTSNFSPSTIIAHI